MASLRTLFLVIAMCGVAAAQPAPDRDTSRDHRRAPPPVPTPPQAYDEPTDGPPAAQAENAAPKAGFVWIGGHYEWRAKKWEWIAGHYERERAGKKWRAARWEKVGAKWKLVAGDWEDAGAAPAGGDYPTSAPPAPQSEPIVAKAGFVWIAGHYEWRNKKYEWIPGHHEREQAGKHWRAAHWDKDGDHWKLVAGDWEAGAEVPAGDYPREAPPPPPTETFGPRAGFLWIAGHYEWRNKKYEWIAGHYERERAGKKWRAARWDKDGDKFVYVAGDWEDGTAAPTEPVHRPRRDWKLERPTVGSYWPPKGKAGSRIVIRGKNFPGDATVMWAGAAVKAAKVGPDAIVFEVPAGAASGAISLKVNGREMPVGNFEVANYDADAEKKKAEDEARKAAEAAIAARDKALAAAAADAAARRAAIQKAIDERIANREQRREERIAEMRKQFDAAFLADQETQDELVLHAQRVANLLRMAEVAQLSSNTQLGVRIEIATKRENQRHDDRMAALKAAFKPGGRP